MRYDPRGALDPICLSTNSHCGVEKVYKCRVPRRLGQLTDEIVTSRCIRSRPGVYLEESVLVVVLIIIRVIGVAVSGAVIEAARERVVSLRVEAARRQLEHTDMGLKQIASATGFARLDVMKRAFIRLLGITPRRYREFAEHSSGD